MSQENLSDNLFDEMTPLGRRTARCTTGVFCALVVFAPLAQVATELCRRQPLQELDVFKQFPTLESIQTFERALERASVVAKAIRPGTQWLMTRASRRGNEKVIVADGGWLFYRPSVEHVLGPGFAKENFAHNPHPTEGAPLPAILHFRDQLAAHGIELLLLPMPSKETICPEQLARGYRRTARPADHPDTARILGELERQSIPVLDAAAVLWEGTRQGGAPFYLPADTHWTPAGMDLIARELAGQIGRSVYVEGVPQVAYRTDPRRVTNAGDLYDMLDLPKARTLLPPTAVTVERVVRADSGQAFQPDPNSPLLLLGDSFTNIYSDATLGWGDSAGLAEHLALHLGIGLDVIALNDGGVNGCRERLARSPAFLQGKRLVLWQFATRDFTLKAGEWKKIPIRVPTPG